jgi:hypothetical protein
MKPPQIEPDSGSLEFDAPVPELFPDVFDGVGRPAHPKDTYTLFAG